MISIENLSKAFGSNRVINNLNISFEMGKVYGVVGKNGSGKTTLFRCLSGLEDYEGLIKSKFDNLKNNLGFLQTNPFILKKITGREYLQLLSNARGINNGNFDKKNIFELPLDLYATTYSTGMKKKLAFTGILVQKNSVFILDEPFNGVDIQSNMIINEIINRLKSLGKTVIIASHVFSTLKETSDEIYLLEGGVFKEKYNKDGFGVLEKEMKKHILKNKIDKLALE